jgi:hypothetical protein
VTSSPSFRAGAGVLLAAASLVPGCSLFLVEGPPPGGSPHAEVACTTSRAAPVLDLAAGGILLVETLASAGAGSTNTGRPGVAAALVGTGALLTISGVVGLRRTGECQAAKEAAQLRENLRSLDVAGGRRSGGDAWLAAGAPPEGTMALTPDAGAREPDGGALDSGAAP